VVQLFLEIHAASAMIPIEPSVRWKALVKSIWGQFQLWVSVKRHLISRYSQEDGGFPTFSSTEDDRLQLLSKADDLNFSIYSEGSLNVNYDEASKEHAPEDFEWPHLTHQSSILQLSSCRDRGGQPLYGTNIDVAISPIDCQRKSFRVAWDVNPLVNEVLAGPSLLPLHVACLYQASSKVIQLLLDTSPLSALSDVVGMLPIHLVASGWTLPALVRPKICIVPPASHGGTLETLTILKKTIPETARVQSGYHGMTPDQYIQECMEDGVYKDTILHILTDPLAALDGADDQISVSTHASSMFVDSSDGSNCCSHPLQSMGTMVASISALIEQRDWQAVLKCVDDDPVVASQWIYGIDDDKKPSASQAVWKRLPIHLACYKGAPLSVMEALIQAFPLGIEIPDPYTRALSLQIACASGASLPVVRVLIDSNPDAILAPNADGRLALHSAVLFRAPYEVIEALVDQDPQTSTAVDQYDETPFSYAVQIYGDAHMITELLSKTPWFEQVEVEWEEEEEEEI
jgi:hypothetical protein